jgi:hypothetical protein
VATVDYTRRLPSRARRLPYVREAIIATALAGMVGAAFMLAAEVASAPSQFVRWSLKFGYPNWLAGPLEGLAEPITVKGFIALSVLLYALYLVVIGLSAALRLSWVLAAVVALHVIFLLGPPMYLTDVFNYLGFARLDVLHGLNPYEHTLVAAPTDAAFRYVTWPDLISPYGPLFAVSSFALVPLGIAKGVWALKLTVTAASLACVGLVWLIARELDRPAAPAVAFVGLNPLLLVYGVGGAHNDMYMLMMLLAGVWLALRGRAALGAGAVVAAAAIKATAGLALPFMWLVSRDRRGVVLGAAVAGAAVIVVAAIAFAGNPFSALSSFSGQSDYAELRSFPGQVTDAILQRHVVPYEVQQVSTALFVFVFALLLALAWRGADWIESIGWTTLALLLTLTWIMPWYIAWLLPFAALSESRRLRYATLAFGIFLLVVHLPYPPIP